MRAGSVNIKIVQLNHLNFTRDNHNLKTDLEISLSEALLGFSKDIIHLDGHTVTITKEPGIPTQQNEVMKVEDEGMPKYGMPSENGDLFVTFKIKSPLKLSQVQQTMFK